MRCSRVQQWKALIINWNDVYRIYRLAYHVHVQSPRFRFNRFLFFETWHTKQFPNIIIYIYNWDSYKMAIITCLVRGKDMVEQWARMITFSDAVFDPDEIGICLDGSLSRDRCFHIQTLHLTPVTRIKKWQPCVSCVFVHSLVRSHDCLRYHVETLKCMRTCMPTCNLRTCPMACLSFALIFGSIK